MKKIKLIYSLIIFTSIISINGKAQNQSSKRNSPKVQEPANVQKPEPAPKQTPAPPAAANENKLQIPAGSNFEEPPVAPPLATKKKGRATKPLNNDAVQQKKSKGELKQQ